MFRYVAVYRQQLLDTAPHEASLAHGCALHSLLLHCPVQQALPVSSLLARLCHIISRMKCSRVHSLAPCSLSGIYQAMLMCYHVYAGGIHPDTKPYEMHPAMEDWCLQATASQATPRPARAARAVLQAGHESAARSPAALQQQRSSGSALRGWLDFMTPGRAAQGAMQMAKHAPTEV